MTPWYNNLSKLLSPVDKLMKNVHKTQEEKKRQPNINESSYYPIKYNLSIFQLPLQCQKPQVF